MDEAVTVVLVPAPAGMPDSLTYLVPPEWSAEAVVGACVLVPLAARQMRGYVLEPAPAGTARPASLRPILAVLDSQPAFDADRRDLLRWLAAENCCSLSDALPLVVPQRHEAQLESTLEMAPDWEGTLTGRAGPVTTRTALDIHRVLAAAGGSLERARLLAAVTAPGAAAVLRRCRDEGHVRETHSLSKPEVRAFTAKAVALQAPGDALPDTEPPAETGPRGRLGPRQRQVMEYLRRSPRELVPQRRVVTELDVDSSVVRRLEARGIVAAGRVPLRRRPAALPESPAAPDPTPGQEAAIAAVHRQVGAGGGAELLLYGVTGSGKTEVYLRAIEQARARGRTAILLVPEISLTVQVAAQMRARLGERVAILHSALSDGERFDEWERLRTGAADVAVGPRSALFAPLAGPGVIVLDEEHDPSYKQAEPAPRYHARDVARERARLGGGCVILGSATPSLETFHAAAEGRIELAELPDRIHGLPLPPVEVVDLRQEAAGRGPRLLGARLEACLQECVAAGEQAILFLNRRGFSAFLLCRDCGLVPRCEHCDLSLTLHESGGSLLLCHYCGYSRPVPELCPRCQGRRLDPFGLGTQRVEQAVNALLPGARVARLDQDATRRAGSHADIIGGFRDRRIDVLIGTQMVTKGFHFPGVTLVGVVTADVALHTPDFRAAERTFQLLTQVSGRAGRGEAGGQVIVQTFCPEHPAVQHAARHDYGSFFRSEIPNRRELSYPPFARLARLLAAAPDAESAEGRSRAAAALLEPFLKDEGITLLGPAPAPLARLRDRYRWHLVLRAGPGARLPEMLQAALPALRKKVGGLAIDVDPVDLL